MSYVKNRRALAGTGRKGGTAVRGQGGLGGLLDALFSGGGGGIIDVYNYATTGTTCPPSSTYTSTKASIQQLEATWNPTGVYTWNDMADMINAVVQLSSQASSMAASYFGGASTSSGKDAVRKAAAQYNAVAQQAGEYTVAWQAGRKAGTPIAAPAFKQWVIDDLSAALALMRTVEIEMCNQPWFVAAAVVYVQFVNAVATVARRVVGVVVQLGENVIKATERTVNLIQYLPYIAVAGGAIYLWSKRKR